MVTKAATRSATTPRSSHSHSHSHSHSLTHTQRTAVRSTTTTPLAAAAWIPPSVGQPLPPAAPATPLRTPGTQPPPRSSSPNYFGFVSDPAVDTHDSGEGPARTNWSSSSVVSFGDASKPVPLSANPEFESFRRQTEAYNGFNLSRGSLAGLLSTPAASRPASLDQRSAGSPAPEHPSTSMPKHHDRSNPFAKPEGDLIGIAIPHMHPRIPNAPQKLLPTRPLSLICLCGSHPLLFRPYRHRCRAIQCSIVMTCPPGCLFPNIEWVRGHRL